MATALVKRGFMDHKTLEQIQEVFKKDVLFFAKQVEECEKIGTDPLFDKGRLYYAKTLVSYFEDLKEIYYE